MSIILREEEASGVYNINSFISDYLVSSSKQPIETSVFAHSMLPNHALTVFQCFESTPHEAASYVASMYAHCCPPFITYRIIIRKLEKTSQRSSAILHQENGS